MTALLCFSLVIGGAQPENPDSPLVSRIQSMLLDAFKEGGPRFLAHARSYRQAVDRIDALLDDPSSPTDEIAEACENLATILNETQFIMTQVELDRYKKVCSSAMTLLDQQHEADCACA